jgi:hypothetical protein
MGTVSLLLALCTAPPAAAQVLYGSLTGNVTDPSGAALPGAGVEALNVATGVAREDTAGSAGVYRFPELLPGIYKVTISAPGFTTLVTENVRVDANTVRRVDAQLAVARHPRLHEREHQCGTDELGRQLSTATTTMRAVYVPVNWHPRTVACGKPELGRLKQLRSSPEHLL